MPAYEILLFTRPPYIFIIGVMTSDQKTWFVQFYQKLSEYTRPVTAASISPAHRPMSSTQRRLEADEDKVQVECRRLCAYNFPVSQL